MLRGITLEVVQVAPACVKGGRGGVGTVVATEVVDVVTCVTELWRWEG